MVDTLVCQTEHVGLLSCGGCVALPRCAWSGYRAEPRITPHNSKTERGNGLALLFHDILGGGRIVHTHHLINEGFEFHLRRA